MELEGCDSAHAASAIDATLGFLKLCADHPERSFVPAPAVDAGWHAFLLYTREYRTFCERHAGSFIDHEPNDSGGAPGGTCVDTIDFMRSHGVPFDADVWLADGTDAGDCRSQPSPCQRPRRERSAAEARL